MYPSTSRHPVFRPTADFYGNSVIHPPDPLNEDSIHNSKSRCLRWIHLSGPKQLQLHLSSPSSTMRRIQGSSLSLECFLRGWLHPAHRARNCESLCTYGYKCLRSSWVVENNTPRLYTKMSTGTYPAFSLPRFLPAQSRCSFSTQ